MCCQAGSVIYSNIYRAGRARLSLRRKTQANEAITDDSPLYRRGNKDLIAICVGNIFLYLTVHLYYKWVNSRRDKIWDSWSSEERENYIKTTTAEGNKRLDFRFDY